MGAFIKRSVRAVISCDRFPEIVGAIWIFGIIQLLSSISSTRQIVIALGRNKLVAKDCFHGRPRNVILAAIRMMRGVGNRAGCDFWLKNRWNRLCLVRQSALDPAELRRVERGHLYHHGTHLT